MPVGIVGGMACSKVKRRRRGSGYPCRSWYPQVLVRRRCITGYRFCIGLRKSGAAARFIWLSVQTWLPQEGDASDS